MTDGVKHVRAAAELLKDASTQSTEHNLSDRLLMAAAEWWRALASREHWSPMLQGKADCIAAKLLARGSLQLSIAAMTDAELLDLARDLHAFAMDLGEETHCDLVGVCAEDDVYIAYPFH